MIAQFLKDFLADFLFLVVIGFGLWGLSMGCLLAIQKLWCATITPDLSHLEDPDPDVRADPPD